jgi:excisionase family DNA binding protein
MANLTYSISEVAEELGISRGLAYEMARTHKIPILKIGGRLLVPKDQFEEWLSNSIRNTQPADDSGNNNLK